MASPTVRFVTFGCKVNQYDTQVLRERLLAAGYVEDTETPEVIVVNTCTVTVHGGAAARKSVRRLARDHPGADIYLTGCYAQSDPDVVSGLPGVRGVFGTSEREALLADLGAHPAAGSFIEERVVGLAGRSRAFVKVQDGCRQFCTYCIVPHVRPEVTSKRPDTVVEEVRGLVQSGHREVVLTGVHLGAYGTDGAAGAGTAPLRDLVARLLEETDLPRLRLSSIEATEVGDDLLALLAPPSRIAPHLHLPLQAGSARVLERMGRPCGPEDFLAVTARIRERVPGCAISTDLIVGFPGESPADFLESLEVLRRAGMMRTHVFPFSPRPGTPAEKMDGAVHSKEIRRRADEADECGRTLAREFAQSRIGRRASALALGPRPGGRMVGLTGRYLRVHFDGPGSLAGNLVPVRLREAGAEGLLADRIEE